jgi:DNA-binding IclR family transcriptional regulator
LGVIIDCLAAKSGATADDLVAATGWQRHSVLGALSRLRSRGFTMQLDAIAERKAYRLGNPAQPIAQTRARG